MTPTREQLGVRVDAIHEARGYADQAERELSRAGMAESDAERRYFLAMAWQSYHALGEALRQTGTEPPQPAEGA